MADKKYQIDFEMTDGSTQSVEFTVPQGEKGDPGDDYVLTEADKQEIAELAAPLVDVPEGGGGSGFSLPLLYEVTTTEEVRWIDTGDNAFEAKNMIIVDLLSKATASNTETKGICASIYTEKSKPTAPYSNYGLTSGIANMLSGQNDMRARLVGFRGNSGNWTVFYAGRSEANDGGFSPYMRLSSYALMALPIKGLIIGDEAAKAGTRVLGIGTTLKIWGC